jgi:hypothetical protein
MTAEEGAAGRRRTARPQTWLGCTVAGWAAAAAWGCWGVAMTTTARADWPVPAVRELAPAGKLRTNLVQCSEKRQQALAVGVLLELHQGCLLSPRDSSVQTTTTEQSLPVDC